jgi:O-antigen/teichoic acid export membrane protein
LKPAIHHWKPALVRPLLRSGTDFFLLQIAGLIVFNSDNLVIAHYLGVQQVTPYSVTWRLVGYAAALQIILTPALWPAYAEAWVRHDLRWIRATLGKVIIRIWAGPSAVPSQMLLVLMCAWILISTFMANTATVLAATDNARLQARLSLIAAGINLAASIWLVQRIGPAGVLLGTIGSYLLVLIVPQTWKAMQVLRIIESPQDGHV